MQQIDYEIRKVNYINTIAINGYISFIQSLLRDTTSSNMNNSSNYYFDIVARFNNSFLIPVVQEKIATSKRADTDSYKEILASLREL